ncbi:WxL domain-containing protein, partial [Enterococcus faecalis]
MKKTVLLTSATILLGVGFQAINASAAETFPKEYNTEGTITFEAGDNEITPPVDPEN